ncbi:MAG: efflux RND transporter permease subunit, partial [bacterium]
IHTHLAKNEPITRATLAAGVETMVPRFLAMMSILAVFVPSFFMVGITGALFVPLSLAVGFAMVSSFLLSSTLVPVMAVWLVKPQHHDETKGPFHTFQTAFGNLVRTAMPFRMVVVPIYLIAALAVSLLLFTHIGREMFPSADTDEFRIRIRCLTGTRVEVTEKKVLQTIDLIKQEAGPGNVEATLGYAGQQPVQFVISSVFLWTSGPHEAVMDIRLRKDAKIDLTSFKDRMRKILAQKMPDVAYSFEPGDIVSQIMNLGSPTPIQVIVKGPDMDDSRAFARKIKDEMAKIPWLRDLQYGQPQDYPTVDIKIDRELAGQFGLTPAQVGNSLVPATSSSRY